MRCGGRSSRSGSCISGEFVAPAAGRITVRELAEEFRDARKGQVSVRAWESDESALRVHIVPAFGKLPISSVTPPLVERFLVDLAVSRSVRTAARVRTTLRGLFRYAVRTRRLAAVARRDWCRCRTPTRGRGRSLRSTPSRVAALLDVVDTQRELSPGGADITLVLALTGLRFGELRGLRVRDVVSVPYPGIVVKRSIPQSGLTGAVIERATTKSGRSRMVPLSELVLPVVMRAAEGKEPDDLLFPAPEGRVPPRSELAAADSLEHDRPRAGVRTTCATRRQACGSRPVWTSRRCRPGWVTRPRS